MSDTEYQPIATVTVADLLEQHVRCDAALDEIGEIRKEVREQLTEAAISLEEMTGAAFTARAEAGKALRTNPLPRVSVADASAFGAQLRTCELDGLADLVADRTRYELGHGGAEELHRVATDNSADLRESILEWITETHDLVVGEKALEVVAPFTVVAEDPYRLVWTSGAYAGEVVDGVQVNPPGKRTLTVTPDKVYRARLREMLRSSVRLIGGAS